MVVGEGQRRVLHERLVEVLGVDQADLLMEHLPPSGWGDVARRADVDHLEIRMRSEMVELRSGLVEAMGHQTRTVIIAMASMVASVVGSFAIAVVTFHR